MFPVVLFMCYLVLVNSIRCIDSLNGEPINNNVQCPPWDTLCANLVINFDYCGIHTSGSAQGCGNKVYWTINFKTYRCQEKGIFNFSDYDPRYSGYVNCCDTDLCSYNNVPISSITNSTTSTSTSTTTPFSVFTSTIETTAISNSAPFYLIFEILIFLCFFEFFLL